MKRSLIHLYASLVVLLISIDLPAQPLTRIGSGVSIATSDGDYRTVRSGLWSKDSTWARYVAGVWTTPASPPDSSAGVITVSSGHTISIKSSLVYDQVIVEAGGQVVVGSGVVHALADGPGNDLTINGTWLNQGGTWTILGSARWAVNDGGTFIHNTTSGISTPLSKAILARSSNFVYRGGASLTPASTFAGRSYGNLFLDTSGGAWTCTASGSTSLTINGSLSIGPGVKWNTGGFSGTIAVQGSTSIGGEWTGSGSANQAIHTFGGPFVVQAGGRYALATSGGSQGGLIIQSDLTNNGSLVVPSNRPILFGGQNPQLITGSVPLSFSNGLTVNNPAGIVLGCDVNVDDTLEMVVGNLLTGTRTVNLGPGAFLIEADAAAVLGRISTVRTLRNGVNESFGNIGLEIKATGGDPGAATLTRVTGLTSSPEGVVSIGRYFDLSPSLNAGIPAEIKFHFSDSELNGAIKGALRLFKSSDGGTTWTNEGGSVDVLRNVIAVDGVASPSRWTAGEPIPAPTVSSVTPSFGEIGSYLTLTITGSGFVQGLSTLTFSGTGISVGSVSVLSATQIVAGISISASSAPGFRDVLVSNGSVGAANLQNGFEVRQHLNPYPVVTGVSPALGVRGRTVEAIIRGSGFVAGLSSVTVGNGVDVRSIRIMGDAEILVSIAVNREAALGERDVVVLNPPPGGGRFVFPRSFSVLNPAPSVTSCFPSVVERGQSVWLRIEGEDFVSDTARVDIGEGTRVDTIIVESPFSLRAKISVGLSAPVGPRNLAVINSAPGGGTSVFPAALSVVNPAPGICGVIPDSGAVGETIDVVISGSKFLTDATSARIGNGVTIDSLMVLSDSTLKARVRIALSAFLGPRDLTVSNQSPGGGASTLTGGFVVKSPVPTIVGINPASAVSGKQTSLTLDGCGYVPGLTRLEFGPGVTVDSMEFHGTTRILAWISISSSMVGGARDISLMNPAPGGGKVCLPGAFVVSNPRPTLSGLSATSGSRGSSFTIMLNGTNFVQGVTSLAFGEGIVVDSVRVSGRDCLFAQLSIARSAAPGSRNAVITNCPPGGGSHMLPSVFTVINPMPSIRRAIPSTVCIGETVPVTINGLGFLEGATAVDFGQGIALQRMTIDTSGSILTSIISIDTSAVPGSRAVVVSNAGPGGGSASLPNAIGIVYPVPILSSFTPLGGNRAQTLEIVVTGRNFIPGATSLSLGDNITVNALRVSSSAQILGTITIGAEAALGQRNVVLSNPSPAGGASRLTNAFTVANSAPMLVRVTPSTVPRGQTCQVVLEGMNFVRGETSVGFGEGIAADSISVISLTRITAKLNVAATATVGPRTITVANPSPGGGSSTLVSAYAVVYPLPIFSKIDPAAGYRGKPLKVSVTGSNFEPKITSVDFGPDIAVASPAVCSPFLLTAEIHVGASARKGVRAVVVRNEGPGGGAMSLDGIFAVWNPQPTIASLAPSEGLRGKTIRARILGDGYLDGETTVDFGSGITVSDLEVRSRSEISVKLDIDRTAEPGPRVVSVSNAQPGGGTATLGNVFLVKPDSTAHADNRSGQIPPQFALSGAFPNPFNPRTAISYQLSAVSLVSLKVFNLLGSEIATLVSCEQSAGVHTAWFDAGHLTSGVYVIRLVAESVDTRSRLVASRKLVLLR